MRIKIDRDKRIKLLGWLQSGYIDGDTLILWYDESRGKEPIKLPKLTARDLAELIDLDGADMGEVVEEYVIRTGKEVGIVSEAAINRLMDKMEARGGNL